MDDNLPLYRYWSDYPKRDVEYVRWYPPTLQLTSGQVILDALARGPEAAAFYLHIPFCKDVCPYCPFNKYRMREDRALSFLDGIEREIEMVGAARRRRGTRTTSGYFGGGTPTALETPDLLRIIERCLTAMPPEPGAEMTVEANPDTVDLEKLKLLKASGINRVSFGVQSFNDRFLKVLGRTHGSQGAVRAIELARQAGFDNIAIDLIYRVPGQTVELWEDDLATAIALDIEHISTYCLFLDPGTRLYNDTLAGNVADYPAEADEIAMYRATHELLGAGGYEHYTINDFAKKGRRSEHHLSNWQAPQRSYAGMGPGAFSYTQGDGGEDAYVYCTIHSLQEYLDTLKTGQLPVRLANHVSFEERRARYMVLGLRCLEVEKAPFKRLFGQEMNEVFGTAILQLKAWGLIEEDARRVVMTERGRHFASNVLKAFYTPANHGKPQAIGVELLAGKGQSLISVTPRPEGEDADMKSLDAVKAEDWAKILTQVFQHVSEDPRCKPILASIGPIRFQLLLTDRPELSYWEEYTGDRVIPHLGVIDERTVQASTTFPMLTGTLLRTVSLMEAAADEAWDIKGDTEVLIRCANLLPYVMTTFSRVLGIAEVRT